MNSTYLKPAIETYHTECESSILTNSGTPLKVQGDRIEIDQNADTPLD